MAKGIILGITMVLICSTTALAEMVVIVNKKNPVVTLTVDKVTSYFKKADELWDSNHRIVPIELPDTHPLAIEFTTRVMRMSISMKQAMWTIKALSGKGTRPKEVKTEAEVVTYVAAEPWGIGYVDRARVDDTVKIVDVKF